MHLYHIEKGSFKYYTEHAPDNALSEFDKGIHFAKEEILVIFNTLLYIILKVLVYIINY